MTDERLTSLTTSIAVRGYAPAPDKTTPQSRRTEGGRTKPGQSKWVLIFDTETSTDPGQRLRIGTYQVRKLGETRLHAHGVFCDPAALSPKEVKTTFKHSRDRGFSSPLSLHEFIEQIFYKYCVDYNGRCVGFNLPFDLSRLAYAHAPAQGELMRGGFSFLLTSDRRRPRVQVRHLNNRSSFIQFAVPARRSFELRNREKGGGATNLRGAFIDVRTLGAALTGRGHSLASLARLLKTPHQKSEVDDYEEEITPEFLDYAANDVQVTWECFERLQAQYDALGLKKTASHEICSEATVGKAYLKEMNLGQWRKLQLDFPPDLLGIIMSTYYGGRSEVRIRRNITRVVYCDFLSMYPTVCNLMNLWRFAVAKGVVWSDTTDEVRALLGAVSLQAMQNLTDWQGLPALVQVRPDGNLFPVRSRYSEQNYSIGLNYLSATRPIWYTLADCITSTLLTGKQPNVVKAIRFKAGEPQDGLVPINIAGNEAYRVDPYQDDFYRRLIELRQQIKNQMMAARARGDKETEARLDAEQQAMKITANSTSYGIFVEMNVTHFESNRLVVCYGAEGAGFETHVHNVEKPGNYFHPLLGTLITGAARLMLAIAEVLAQREQIGWAMCDTDSLSFERPDAMEDSDFLARVERVRSWFDALNPYRFEEDLFKREDVNFALGSGNEEGQSEALYCYAVSAKRYVLFNLDPDDRPVIRKASAHGLGHLLSPYGKDDSPSPIPAPAEDLEDIGVDRWEYDLWYRVIEEALNSSDQVPLTTLPGFDKPAVIRYAATTPTLLNWFSKYNEGRPFADQVKPFNFLLMFHTSVAAWRAQDADADGDDLFSELPQAVAPFGKEVGKAAEHCFDRYTQKPVPASLLKTYAQALAQYHLHPESKFERAEWTDRGETKRWHVSAEFIEYIGKEANRWEEQLFLGADPEAQVYYSFAPGDVEVILTMIDATAKKYGVKALAPATGLSRQSVHAVIERKPTSATTLLKLARAVPIVERQHRERIAHQTAVLNAARAQAEIEGTRAFARRARVDHSNLLAALDRRRRVSAAMLAKLESVLVDTPVLAGSTITSGGKRS